MCVGATSSFTLFDLATDWGVSWDKTCSCEFMDPVSDWSVSWGKTRSWLSPRCVIWGVVLF